MRRERSGCTREARPLHPVRCQPLIWVWSRGTERGLRLCGLTQAAEEGAARTREVRRGGSGEDGAVFPRLPEDTRAVESPGKSRRGAGGHQEDRDRGACGEKNVILALLS